MTTMYDILKRYPNLVQVSDEEGCLGIIERQYNQRIRYFSGLGHRASIIVCGDVVPVSVCDGHNFYFFLDGNPGLLHFKMRWETTKIVRYTTFTEYKDYLHGMTGHRLT